MFLRIFVAGLLATLSIATDLKFPSNSTTPCILINLQADNSLGWKENDTVHYVSNWNFTNSKVIGGNCKIDKPYLVVKWDVDNATMKFEFSKNSGNEVNVTMTLSFEPDVVFSKFNNTDNSTVDVSVTYRLGSAEKAFKCLVQQEKNGSNGDYKMQLGISNLMIQGYNVKNGSFSDVEECKADPTPSPSPTPTPTPAPQTLNKVYLNATDGNKTCAMVAGKFQFMISYLTTDNKTNTSTVDIPSKGLKSKGNCSVAKDNTLTAMFYKDWTVTFDFKGDGTSVWLKSLTLQYPLDSPFFPKSKYNTSQTASVVFEDSAKQYKAAQSGSYMCNSETKLALNSSVTLHLTDFQYAAFQSNITSFKDGNISECSADAKTSSIVPIAVGAALAGLVVIVLIAYLIGRRRNRKGYESV